MKRKFLAGVLGVCFVLAITLPSMRAVGEGGSGSGSGTVVGTYTVNRANIVTKNLRCTDSRACKNNSRECTTAGTCYVKYDGATFTGKCNGNSNGSHCYATAQVWKRSAAKPIATQTIQQ